MHAYFVEVKLSKQEDGLWRAEVPALPGCFADNETLHGALRDIQECAAMFLDLQIEEGSVLPGAITDPDRDILRAMIPVIVEEHSFRRLKPRRKSRAR